MDLSSFTAIFNTSTVISDRLHIFPLWYLLFIMSDISMLCKMKRSMLKINIWVWSLILIWNILYILCEILSTCFISHVTEVSRPLTLTSGLKCSLQFLEIPCPLYGLSNSDTVIDLIICTCAVKTTNCLLSFVEQMGQFYISNFTKILWT